ncbi:MAG: hypothetical protein ACR2P8_09940, partial [Myxococcota bacterium]
MAESPTLRTVWISGLAVGLSATFGRNHALYCVLGQLATLALVFMRGLPSKPLFVLGCWAGGAILGYAPVLGLMLFASGFAESFLLSLVQFMTMPRPVPWPWRVATQTFGSPLEALRTWLTSLLYVGMA